MSNDLDKNYWENKYTQNKTGWDIGHASPPIIEYFNQIKNQDLAILIPGAGNSYEAEYLYQAGFKNIDVLDIAAQPLMNFKKRVPSFPEKQLIQGDFFRHNKKYDLIIEQTFFCAINPETRGLYAKKMANLIKDGGKLIGLLFDFPLTEEGPPFGGSIKSYKNIFSEFFQINTLEPCYNSIKPREKRELFIIFEKKNKQ